MRRRGAGLESYRRTALPESSTDWRTAPFCALDLELTGLDPRRDEIISFAVVPIQRGSVQLGRIVAGYVRPEQKMSEPAIRIHGIRPADLEDAAAAPDALEPLFAALAGRVPVVHCAAVERTFLRRALRGTGVRVHKQMVDTQLLGRLWRYERDGILTRAPDLAELAASLSLPVHRQHDAATDALTTAQVFIALASLLERHEPQSVGRLCGAERRVANLRAFAPGS